MPCVDSLPLLEDQCHSSVPMKKKDLGKAMLMEGAEPRLRRAQPGCSHKDSQKRKHMAPGMGEGMRPHLAPTAWDLSVELCM